MLLWLRRKSRLIHEDPFNEAGRTFLLVKTRAHEDKTKPAARRRSLCCLAFSSSVWPNPSLPCLGRLGLQAQP